MKSSELSILAAVVALLVLFLYPPFMCIDPESGGRVHGTLGHHAIWKTPTPEYAYGALYPNARELPDAERRAGLVPRVNRVRLVIYAFAITLAGGLAQSVLRRQDRRRHQR